MSEQATRVPRMPAKDPEMRRATMRAWYARTKDARRTPERVVKERASKRARRIKNATWLAELKTQLICSRCGEDHPGCLQFHHRDPKVKEISVAIAVRRGWGRDRI